MTRDRGPVSLSRTYASRVVPGTPREQFGNATSEAVDALLLARGIGDGTDRPLRFYDGVSHRGVFGVPKPIRAGLATETRIITRDNPVFMY